MFIIADVIGSDVPCYNMGNNGHGINLFVILMGNLQAGGHSDTGELSHSTPELYIF